MNPLELIQRTPEWLTYRAGKVTASGICDLMRKTRDGNYSQTRAAYMGQVVRDRYALRADPAYVPPRGYNNAAMQWGTDTEPMARSAYSMLMDTDVIEVGFVDHPNIPLAGCSPDGLVGEQGLVEIKCPETHSHITTLIERDISNEYIVQIQWQMACTGREWNDFVSYDPRLPPRLCMYRQRVYREDVTIKKYEAAVIEFQAEAEELMARLDRLYPPDDEIAA